MRTSRCVSCARRGAPRHIAAGELKYREGVITGIEKAPRALANVLTGRNQGKQLIKIG